MAVAGDQTTDSKLNVLMPWRPAGSVVQCSACKLKVVSLIMAHSIFLGWIIWSIVT